ncbi:MAG: carboxypeptidase regulatory-like domain-containing protein [Cyclobacteriaceae bacterium]|nr:carboxypeptidase regulatory-like domain-containing protein [Cyclobacteriaceae bacterium]
MRQVIIIFFWWVGFTQAWSQSTNISGLFQNPFNKAERMYMQQGYRHAINLYRIVLDRNPDHRLAKARVADCYYRMGQFEEANRWCRMLISEGQPTADEFYHWAQVLSALERYDSAYQAYAKALALDSTECRAKTKMQFIERMEFYRKDPASYAMNRQWYNSPVSDFSPRHFGEGIVFVSSRDREAFIKRTPWDGLSEQEGLLNAFYVGSSYDSSKSLDDQVSLFYSRSLNSPYHDGPVTFYQNGTRIAYTRNLVEDGKPVKDEWGRVNLELYFATLGDNRSLTRLEKYPYNSRSYSIAHPWISEDGSVLYFSSNMPGGKGGADLYVSYYREGQWTKPENLGDGINSRGDEFSPYWWNDQLFFSSDGFGGFGGLDNFVASRTGDVFGSPENLGYPLNSSHDDFGLIIDGAGREGYFASNRLDRNDDIYKFHLRKVTVVGHVREMRSNQAVPLAGVSLRENGQSEPVQIITDERGNFRVELEVEKDYHVIASKEGYATLGEQVLQLGQASIVADTLDVTLWKHALFARGVVYSDELQQKLPGATVYLHNLKTGTVDSIKTGEQAAYHFLVLPNMQYRISARYPGYLERGFNLNTHNLFEGDLLNDFLLEEVYLDKMTVFFGYDQWILRPEFERELNRIIRSLQKNKTATVYIGAHADTQGTREYNKNLSDKRANAVVQFLKNKGIVSSRIQAFGFGEELILNLCSDGVDCSDEEHSRNRRAEIKVQTAEMR